jgi:hypothetical protein
MPEASVVADAPAADTAAPATGTSPVRTSMRMAVACAAKCRQMSKA